jgi:hypothetical protein
MSRATCRGTQTRSVGEVVDDEPARGEVLDEEPRDVPRQPDARRGRSSRRRASRRSLREAKWSTTSRATCRGTRMRDVGEVVDNEPVRGKVVDDEPRDEPRDVPRYPDAWRRRTSRRRAARRAEASGRAA